MLRSSLAGIGGHCRTRTLGVASPLSILEYATHTRRRVGMFVHVRFLLYGGLSLQHHIMVSHSYKISAKAHDLRMLASMVPFFAYLQLRRPFETGYRGPAFKAIYYYIVRGDWPIFIFRFQSPENGRTPLPCMRNSNRLKSKKCTNLCAYTL